MCMFMKLYFIVSGLIFASEYETLVNERILPE